MPSSPIITPSLLNSIFTSFNTLYQNAYNAAPVFYDKVASVIPSGARSETYAWLAEIPQVREWIGPRNVTNLAARAYRLENKDYELTFAVSRNDIADEQLAVYSMSVPMLGSQMKVWPDKRLAEVIEAGLTTTTTIDGQLFFDSDHPVNPYNSALGTFSNRFDNTIYGGSTTRPLNAANFALIYAAMRRYKAESGRPMGIKPTILMVPPALEFTARQILNTSFIAPAVAFGMNAASTVQSNPLQGMCELLVNPYLTSDTRYYMLDTSQGIKPFVWQLRQAPELTYLVNPNDPNVFNLNQYEYGAFARGNGGYSLPFLVATGDA